MPCLQVPRAASGENSHGPSQLGVLVELRRRNSKKSSEFGRNYVARGTWGSKPLAAAHLWSGLHSRAIPFQQEKTHNERSTLRHGLATSQCCLNTIGGWFCFVDTNRHYATQSHVFPMSIRR